MKRATLYFFFTIVIITNLFSQSSSKELASGYYMVLAAYAQSAESYAQKYVSFLQNKSIDAAYGFSNSKNLFFVYSASYNTKTEAIKSIQSERKRTGESEAWVYIYKTANVEIENNSSSIVEKEMEESIKKNSSFNDESIIENNKEKSEDISLEKPAEKDDLVDHSTPQKAPTYLFIEAYDATSGKPITIDFMVVDLARKAKMATIKSHAAFLIKEPTSASKMVQIQSDNVAWQKQSLDFNYNETEADPSNIFIHIKGDTTYVKFELKFLQKGDRVTLYQVFFYKDASIMMEKSSYELDQVVTLLENNPDIKIRIHGHTNGNATGKIIALKENDSINFFNIDGDHRQLFGSAKKLSEERARIVGKYLESKGISASRFEVKGWGGKKMIYNKQSEQAKYNVRVEVEVLKD